MMGSKMNRKQKKKLEKKILEQALHKNEMKTKIIFLTMEMRESLIEIKINFSTR